MSSIDSSTPMPRQRRRFQLSIKTWFVITAILGFAIAFPEFAFVAPVVVAFSLIIAAIILIAAGAHYLLAIDPQPILAAAGRNLRGLLIVNFFIVLYIVYGWLTVNFDLG